MNKRRITKQQQSRIKARHEKRVSRQVEGDALDVTDEHLGPEQTGLLIAHYGSHVEVEADRGELYRCALRQNMQPLVTGDHVIWRVSEDNVGVVTALMPRSSLLYRHDPLKQTRPVAANVDQLIIVIAKAPEPSFELVDRYLVVAHALKLHPIIVINKIELFGDDDGDNDNNKAENKDKSEREKFYEMLNPYHHLHYPLFWLSCESGVGVSELEKSLVQHTNVFVGQSGVGKSSLLLRLLPERDIRVGELHEATGLGRHTTTVTRLYHFPGGGDLIDSPGVREFGLQHLSAGQVLDGFAEIKKYASQCKFRDCAHASEPACVVREAIEGGEMDLRRLESFRSIVGSLGG